MDLRQLNKGRSEMLILLLICEVAGFCIFKLAVSLNE